MYKIINKCNDPRKFKSNQVVISPSNVEVSTYSDYEVNRLELYNEYNSDLDFRLRKH